MAVPAHLGLTELGEVQLNFVCRDIPICRKMKIMGWGWVKAELSDSLERSCTPAFYLGKTDNNWDNISSGSSG